MGWGSARINLDRESQFCKGGLNLTGLHPPFFFAALHESGNGRYCCKSPKLPAANFSAAKKSD
jgi:hypothetical protein